MKRSRLPLILLLPLITVVCLVLFYIAGIPLSIPKYAENLFGPATDRITFKEKLYLSTLLILQKRDLTTAGKPSMTEVPFVVELGESPISVINRLSELGLLQNPDAFRSYLVYKGIDTKIQAGNYTLEGSLNPIEIADILQDSTPLYTNISILAGWRAEEIAESLQYVGVAITPDDFLAEVAQNNAEGFLYPGVYSLPRDTTAESVIQTARNAFNAVLNSEMKNGFNQNGLSIQEAVTLASIVEKETVIDEEMPIIASVFLNRLKIGMKLEADPTVQYALGYNPTQDTWWTNPLLLPDLEVDSPYNTYLNPGLPPGPICNPGFNSLRAVAFPAKTPYHYFRATCDNSGRHNFAVTYDEHKENACP
jgi:UPF0755 protein